MSEQRAVTVLYLIKASDRQWFLPLLRVAISLPDTGQPLGSWPLQGLES